MTALTIQALGALLIGGVFVFAGIEHFVKFGVMRDYLAAQKFPAPALMLAAGSTVEIIAGSLLAIGAARPFAAVALVIFTLATNLMLLSFWASEEPERQVLRNAFLINIAVIGGLLLAGTVCVVVRLGSGRSDLNLNTAELAGHFRNEALRKPLFSRPLDRRQANPHSACNPP